MQDQAHLVRALLLMGAGRRGKEGEEGEKSHV